MGGLLVSREEKTLASVSSPGDVLKGALSRLLGLFVRVESLSLDGLRAEEEVLFATKQVPLETIRLLRVWGLLRCLLLFDAET